MMDLSEWERRNFLETAARLAGSLLDVVEGGVFRRLCERLVESADEADVLASEIVDLKEQLAQEEKDRETAEEDAARAQAAFDCVVCGAVLDPPENPHCADCELPIPAKPGKQRRAKMGKNKQYFEKNEKALAVKTAKECNVCCRKWTRKVQKSHWGLARTESGYYVGDDCPKVLGERYTTTEMVFDPHADV